jgi:hypothetical protein
MKSSSVSARLDHPSDRVASRAIPARFVRAVRQHLLLNFMELGDYPVILGIVGMPGEGKTFQLRTILDSLGVEQRSISAADLESENAGEPGKLLLAEYVRASQNIASGTPSALVIDDIDTTVGEWANNTGTVNHQQILAQLMHLADRPSMLERLRPVRRIPIFTTGNDFSKIYPRCAGPVGWSACSGNRRSRNGGTSPSPSSPIWRHRRSWTGCWPIIRAGRSLSSCSCGC